MKRSAAIVWIASGALVGSAGAQQSTPAPAPSTPPAAPALKPPVPGLDDLLGTPKDKRPDARPEGDQGPLAPDTADPHKAELERVLTASEASDVFKQAIRQMVDAANLLELAGDPGLPAQRLQEEILRKLDTLIDQAEQSQQQQQQQSSSSSQQQQQQSQTPTQPQASQQEQAGQQSSDPQDGVPGPRDLKGELPDVLDSARAAWGALPDRVRDTLLQGAGDKPSALYRRMTEEYYRRLAEEGAPK